MCLSAVHGRKQITLMDRKIVMQLTPQVLKDMYLFVSRLRIIDLNISVLLEKGF